jgi:hypothetical protein
MDHRTALDLIEPCSKKLLQFQLQAYREFDEVHASGADPTLRLSVERSRPKWVNERINWLLEMEYGAAGPVRLVKQDDGLKYLLIEGRDFNLGIRAKKLDTGWRSYNHKSDQQDTLRRRGLFDDCDVPTHHLVLGYRDTSDLQPALSHVAITHECNHVEVVRLLWTASAGVIPIEAHSVQLSLELPQPPGMRRRRRDDESDDEALNKKRG